MLHAIDAITAMLLTGYWFTASGRFYRETSVEARVRSVLSPLVPMSQDLKNLRNLRISPSPVDDFAVKKTTFCRTFVNKRLGYVRRWDSGILGQVNGLRGLCDSRLSHTPGRLESLSLL
jgi:hypothetical protein